ncbi:MAG: arylesterase [Opitutus sp.]|nr:arylesterase [Opitutus sp.]MCS6247520.1 arylesterase [Opitutus sp.]MCS6274656.1 arylesterase [Opitutus sp.]MCS6277334.1 arylesterase [Opitutus sp.]MCS6300456.1 arylesterase [Opitutus sp.]
MKVIISLLVSIALGFATLLAAEPAPKTILFYGDSLTAGYGLDDASTQAFPGLIQQKITAAALPYRVINAGLSGETTAGGLRRIDWVLRVPVDIFVLELGGNDGLRGLPPAVAAKNLQAIIDRVRVKNPAVKIVITGMQMPVSMGEDYRQKFAAIFPALAEANQATLLPFLLETVGGELELNLADGVHPNAAGHRIVAENVWTALSPLLRE